MNFESCLKLQLSGDLINAELGYKKLLTNKNISNDLISKINCNLAIICLASKRESKAIILFKNTINLNPEAPIAYNNLGLIFARKQNYDEAIKNFILALKYNPHSKTYFNLALVYEKIGQISKAFNNYKSAINFDQNYAEAFCNLGNLYYLHGNLIEAKKNIEKSIKLNSKIDASFNNLGLIEMAYGNFKSAKKYGDMI